MGAYDSYVVSRLIILPVGLDKRKGLAFELVAPIRQVIANSIMNTLNPTFLNADCIVFLY